MTVKETLETTVKKTYIADDGTQFDYKEQCIQYEKNNTVFASEVRMGKLPHFYADPLFGDIDYNFMWYYVSSEDDVNDIKIALFDDDAAAWEFEWHDYPCWVLAYYCEGAGDIMTYAEYTVSLNDELMDTKKRMKELVSDV